ncbi:MAG: hypothetical protein OXF24_07710 [Hyphomicrobiales bacterium]|nr:hypothetical protein [Hyphomicrobiales bacterium]MCY4054065.1 hypothetical protein [Hyphomicrobiales bacterium]
MKRKIDVLRVIVFEEGLENAKMFVAQCLEKDICVQGRDLKELFKRLNATIYLELPHMGTISPAPDKFLGMWEEGEVLAHEKFLEAPIEARQLTA